MKKSTTKIVITLLSFCSLLFSHQLTKAQCHIDDWTALKALYEATDGDSWDYNFGWEVVKGDEAPTDCNFGSLYGIGLDESGRVDSLNHTYNYKRVGQIPPELIHLINLRILILFGNKLVGNIPSELSNLSNLTILDLSANNLDGHIPSELGNLNKLKMLDLYANSLDGNIPSELGNLKNLEMLNLPQNSLDGHIPSEFGNLNNLTMLNLSGNSLDGNIPSELGNLNELRQLILSFNEFDGNIPPEFGKIGNLEFLSLASNKLIGSIPPEIGELVSLVSLDLYENQLSGSIPSALENLSKIKYLRFYENQLGGSIPKELGKLSNLIELRFSYNQFNGSIPKEIGNLNNLNTLDLRNNKLSGNISSEISRLVNLNLLLLSSNQLSGSIPAEFGELVSLEELYLYNNQISGSIPAELGRLVSLRRLNLEKNQLNGNIPSELGNLSRIHTLALGQNQLTGSIPSELGNLIEMETLDLSSNQLSGRIPSEFNNLKDATVGLSDNLLSGSIPKNLGFGEDGYYLTLDYNYFSCQDISDYYYSANIRSNYRFTYSPQKYKHNSVQYFLIDGPLESISLSTSFNQSGNFTYQWYKNKIPVEGATDTILVLNNVQFEDVGNYTLHIIDSDCIIDDNNVVTFISDPISVRRTDLEGCTDANACNYNQFAMIDDSTCEYLSCDTLTNSIRIKTTNETILSDEQIEFDLVIDSLGLDYSADGLTFTLDTRGNYRIDSIKVINPALSIVEVDVSQLYSNTLSINRINSQLLTSNAPLLRVVASIVVEDIPTDEGTCSHFAIYGGTELANGHFISFDNIYIDVPFSDCSPYNGYGAEGENWLPLVLSISPQNCKTNTGGLAEIKILEDSQAPYTYTWVNEQGTIVLESTSSEKLIKVLNLNAENYDLTVIDASGKKTTMHTCIPLVNSLDGNETCNTNCVDYVTIPYGKIRGTHLAKKEIEIKGFVSKDETVEFSICK